MFNTKSKIVPNQFIIGQMPHGDNAKSSGINAVDIAQYTSQPILSRPRAKIIHASVKMSMPAKTRRACSPLVCPKYPGSAIKSRKNDGVIMRMEL